jgi:hypothetical protein
VAHRKTLTEKQVALLAWIADGCPDGVMDGDGYRVSAAALRTRGLLTTSGYGPTWTAAVTDAGRAYLAKASGPAAPVPRQANVSVTQALVDDVIAAGGSVRVPQVSWQRPGMPDYRRRAELAERYGKVPAGKQPIVTALSYDELQIDLVDAPEGTSRVPVPVPVPARVARFHPVVQDYRIRRERHEHSPAVLPRVSRLLHGLVTEAERRGYTVTTVGDLTNVAAYQPVWVGAKHGHLIITVDEHPSAVRVFEEGVTGRSVYRPSPRSYGLDTTVVPRRPASVTGGTGRLAMSITSGRPVRSRTVVWADRPSWALDDKLPELLREIEIRAAEHRHLREAAAREAVERERAWRAALDVAHERFHEHRRAEALVAQVAAWERAEQIRRYCDAAESNEADPETATWLAWARAHADGLDPLRQGRARMPAPPERISPEDLRPFLDGWDPYRHVR